MVVDVSCRIVFSVVLLVLTGVSVAEVALKCMTLDFIASGSNEGFMIVNTTSQAPIGLLQIVPYNVSQGPAKLAIAAGILAVLVGFVFIVYLISHPWNHLHTLSSSSRRNFVVVFLLNAVNITVAMIVLFVKHRTSSHFNPNGLGTDDFYYAGVFDLETWTCEVNRFQDTTPELDFSHTIDLYGKQCALERAGRWMMIPLMVVSLVVAGVVIFQFVMLKRERNMSESREEGCELDDHGCPLHEH